jgi:hypothetical protein
MNNVQRARALTGQFAKVNSPSQIAKKLEEAFAEVPEKYKLVVSKELRILQSYDNTFNNLKKQQAEVLRRLDNLSQKVTADAK